MDERRDNRRGIPTGLRSALLASLQAGGGTLLCSFWLGLAAPTLGLLPGIGSFGDQRIAVSLQSALLGVSTPGAPQDGSVLAAENALGLTNIKQGGPPTKLDQSINFTTGAPAAATVGGSGYAPTARASSGLPVALSVAPASADVCSLRAGVVSFGGAGTCTVVGDQAGDARFNPAPSARQAFLVGSPVPVLASQMIVFTSLAPANGIVGDPDYTVSAIATSGLPVTFGIDPASNGV